MLFLIPLAEGLVEGAVVLAESTAVRTAVLEAGEVLAGAETRQAVSTYLTTEGRALASHLATAEGRQALTDAVGKGAVELAGNVATKGREAWEIARTALSSEAGKAELVEAGKTLAKTTAKSEVVNEATGYALDKVTDTVQDAIMSKAFGLLEGTIASPAMLEKFAHDAAAHATHFNLAEDMKVLSSELAKGGQGTERLAELSVGLDMARGALPEKEVQINALTARAESLSALQVEEARAKAEMAEGGKLSPQTMESLQHAVSQALDHADTKSQASLSNALESLKHPQAAEHPHAFQDAMAELSVAKDRVMQGLGQETTHLSADLARSAEAQKEAMSDSLGALVPAIVAKNDQEFAKHAELNHDTQPQQPQAERSRPEPQPEMAH